MRVLIACDKFKGSLTSAEVAEALAMGLRASAPALELDRWCVSDGGQGFLAAVRARRPLAIQTAQVRDPLGRVHAARWGWDPVTASAWIESAEAIGLPGLAPAERNPWQASSAGLGDLLRAALAYQPARLSIGLGGTATCDGGLGLLGALGFQFDDAQGQPLPPEPASLARVADWRPPSQALPAITALIDVLNPPIGPTGGVQVYTPQKGGTPAQIAALERGMTQWVQQLERQRGEPLANLPGGGAAGGLGLALYAVLGAELRSGSAWMLDTLGLQQALQACDVLITGEGAYDAQSGWGKLPGQLLQLAHTLGKPAHLVTGQPTARPPAGVTGWDVLSLDADCPHDPERTRQMLVILGQRIGRLLASGRV